MRGNEHPTESKAEHSSPAPNHELVGWQDYFDFSAFRDSLGKPKFDPDNPLAVIESFDLLKLHTSTLESGALPRDTQ